MNLTSLRTKIVAAAVTYTPLSPLPDYTTGQKVSSVDPSNLTQYLNTIFKLGLGVAAGLAVIMIVLGGVQYMSTDAVGGKEEGKEKITSALWGLLLALMAWLILYTINPNLVSTKLTVGQETGSGISPTTAANQQLINLSGNSQTSGSQAQGVNLNTPYNLTLGNSVPPSDPGSFNIYNPGGSGGSYLGNEPLPQPTNPDGTPVLPTLPPDTTIQGGTLDLQNF